MGWFALLAGLLGFFMIRLTHLAVPISYAQYLSLATLAGIDSLIGGFRAASEGKYKSIVFVSGFVVNTLLAAFLAYLGEQLGQQLGLAATVALGWRIFLNLSIIRRHWIDHWEETRARNLGGPAPPASGSAYSATNSMP